jgi:hypothetical protein
MHALQTLKYTHETTLYPRVPEEEEDPLNGHYDANELIEDGAPPTIVYTEPMRSNSKDKNPKETCENITQSAPWQTEIPRLPHENGHTNTSALATMRTKALLCYIL